MVEQLTVNQRVACSNHAFGASLKPQRIVNSMLDSAAGSEMCADTQALVYSLTKCIHDATSCIVKGKWGRDLCVVAANRKAQRRSNVPR